MRAMKTANLAEQLEKRLPGESAGLVRAAGRLAEESGQSLYLVGGGVRDLLLDKANFDLDLVVEGDAIELARKLASTRPARITTHPRFGTAKLSWDEWSIDFATARSETYAAPGVLPTVKPGSIESDLFRRDFTINAMAICLNTHRYGELIDRYRGQADLRNGLIRVLHAKSFSDDATRIWRGLRYEQRLDFKLEEITEELIKREIPMLDTISGSRIRYELECVCRELRPEKILDRAAELGALGKLHPALAADDWLADKFKTARQTSAPGQPSFALYLSLMTYRLSREECEPLIAYLKLTKPVSQALRDSFAIKAKLKTLAYPEIKPSYVYRQLHGSSATAVLANVIATPSPIARQHLVLYLHKLRYVKPTLDGDDLRRMGFTPGPAIRETLERLRDGRLDKKLTTRQDEEVFVINQQGKPGQPD